MNSQPDYELALRETIREGLAVVVTGTGVSIAASYDATTHQSHPQASWSGLLENGLQWLKEHKLMNEDEVEAQLTLLKKNPQTHRFISAAQDVTEGMGNAESKHFADWLRRSVGSIKAKDRSVLDALHAIRKQGNLLATTNYDGLLLEGDKKLSPVTWQDTDALLGAVRNRDVEKIIFLHGYWRQPESVVLDWRSYERITRDEQYRDDLAAFWKTSIWVYVGCGVSGLSDPDFGLLLKRYGERARQARHWDYCLVREDQRDDFQAHFDSKKLNIRAIAFGKNHSDLPRYFQSLLPVPTPQTLPGPTTRATKDSSIPTPPAFYRVPDYIGRNKFIGRKAQLQLLSDWAKPSDSASVLLFEAIGGNGKSMLTWEWTMKHATVVRSDWAGRFWYSFYEKGAIMRDFCQHALAYITQQPREAFEGKTTAEMRVELLGHLHQRPWLLVLDGLERVLVAYHRLDAAEVPDEEVNRPTDKILDRDPCDAIRDEDTDLLREMASAAPSKILISSRLIPRVLLNEAGIPLPGVKPLLLPGLDETDAEELLCLSGIRGTSADIRYYLTSYCGNHPLVIGVLAGLINSPGPHRGNFDAWANDPAYGAKLNLASLDLIQSRNHILRAAIDALEPPSRQLLATLALLSGAVDYKTVAAFNPYLTSSEASTKLDDTIQDLEHRGLLQYDPSTGRYDLHPVVRGVAAGGMKTEEKESYGQRVVDYYSSQPHNPYEQARTIEDLENGLHVVRTLLKIGHHQQAFEAYRGALSNALLFNVEGIVETLSLLSYFFPSGWDLAPKDLNASTVTYLATNAGLALTYYGESQKALAAYEVSLGVILETKTWDWVRNAITSIAWNLNAQNRLAKALRLHQLALTFATEREDKEGIFLSRLFLFNSQFELGQWMEADATWRAFDPMGRNWHRAVYRPGTAEEMFAWFNFLRGTLDEAHLTAAATLAEQSSNRGTLRSLHRLRGSWRLDQGEWALAAASFDEAVTMARDRRLVDVASEIGLTLAKIRLGQLEGSDARSEADRLARLRQPTHRYLAMLWQAIGDFEQAKSNALKAYEWAWADGEPYVHRYELTKTAKLLNELGVPIPKLPPYDPGKDKPFAWEAKVRAAMEELRAEKRPD